MPPTEHATGTPAEPALWTPAEPGPGTPTEPALGNLAERVGMYAGRPKQLLSDDTVDPTKLLVTVRIADEHNFNLDTENIYPIIYLLSTSKILNFHYHFKFTPMPYSFDLIDDMRQLNIAQYLEMSSPIHLSPVGREWLENHIIVEEELEKEICKFLAIYIDLDESQLFRAIYLSITDRKVILNYIELEERLTVSKLNISYADSKKNIWEQSFFKAGLARNIAQEELDELYSEWFAFIEEEARGREIKLSNEVINTIIHQIFFVMKRTNDILGD